jgi:hypothetical protein
MTKEPIRENKIIRRVYPVRNVPDLDHALNLYDWYYKEGEKDNEV